MIYLLCLLAFLIGALAGSAFRGWFFRKKIYGGTIVVYKNSGKTVYTLVLNEDPDDFQNRKDILFKVVASDEGLIRE